MGAKVTHANRARGVVPADSDFVTFDEDALRAAFGDDFEVEYIPADEVR